MTHGSGSEIKPCGRLNALGPTQGKHQDSAPIINTKKLIGTMAQKTLTTSYLSKLANANHDGVTQQIDDRLQAFETENTMLPHPTDK